MVKGDRSHLNARLELFHCIGSYLSQCYYLEILMFDYEHDYDYNCEHNYECDYVHDHYDEYNYN